MGVARARIFRLNLDPCAGGDQFRCHQRGDDPAARPPPERAAARRQRFHCQRGQARRREIRQQDKPRRGAQAPEAGQDGVGQTVQGEVLAQRQQEAQPGGQHQENG